MDLPRSSSTDDFYIRTSEVRRVLERRTDRNGVQASGEEASPGQGHGPGGKGSGRKTLRNVAKGQGRVTGYGHEAQIRSVERRL